MGLKTMVLAGTALATMTVGFAAPAFAATQALQQQRTVAAFPMSAPQGNGADDDVSGLLDESPVCSALGTETIPTGDVVARCLYGGHLV